MTIVPIQEFVILIFFNVIMYKLIKMYNNSAIHTNVHLNKKIKDLELQKKIQEENLEELLVILNDAANISDSIISENEVLSKERSCEFKDLLSDLKNRKCKICQCRIGVKLKGCQHIVHNI
eukprot:NODE_766_length_4395_cov_0.248138.p3 type:complete len:121 gc:universal NODE_766_length_4395_cov_0.248138:1843-2205(+)